VVREKRSKAWLAWMLQVAAEPLQHIRQPEATVLVKYKNSTPELVCGGATTITAFDYNAS